MLVSKRITIAVRIEWYVNIISFALFLPYYPLKFKFSVVGYTASLAKLHIGDGNPTILFVGLVMMVLFVLSVFWGLLHHR